VYTRHNINFDVPPCGTPPARALYFPALLCWFCSVKTQSSVPSTQSLRFRSTRSGHAWTRFDTIKKLLPQTHPRFSSPLAKILKIFRQKWTQSSDPFSRNHFNPSPPRLIGRLTPSGPRLRPVARRVWTRPANASAQTLPPLFAPLPLYALLHFTQPQNSLESMPTQIILIT
jgi:hypothetical protein